MNKDYRNIKALIDLLDNRFSIMGFRFGLDPLIGLIPGLGDAVSLFLSLYIIIAAFRMKLSSKELMSMIANVLIDFVIGLIPGIGDFADFLFKANSRNFEILENNIKKRKPIN